MSFVKKYVSTVQQPHSTSSSFNIKLNGQQQQRINSSVTDSLLNDYEKLKEILQTRLFQNTFDLYQKMVGVTVETHLFEQQPPSNSSTLSSTSFPDVILTRSNSTITTDSLSQKTTLELKCEQNNDTISIISDNIRQICFDTLLNELIDYKLTKTHNEWNELLEILNNQIFRSLGTTYDQTYDRITNEQNIKQRIISRTSSIKHDDKSNTDKFCEETKLIIISTDSPQSTENLEEIHDVILPLSSSSSYSQTMIIQSTGDGHISTDQENHKLYASKLEQYSSQKLKIVRIDKRLDEPLGCTIRSENDSVFISRIINGGICDQDKSLFQINDEILEINFHSIRGRTVNDVVELIQRLHGKLIFIILPCEQQINSAFISDSFLTNFYIRTLFKYDPDDDLYLPCKDLGLFFSYGDILHVVNQQDINWWQAYRVDEDETQQLAGLIPSQIFQEKRFQMIKTLLDDNDENRDDLKKKKLKMIRSCCRKSSEQQQQYEMKQQTIQTKNSLCDIFTYIHIQWYIPRSDRKRPIVLIGPSSIGRHELRQRLMLSSDLSSIIDVAVPHTSRTRKSYEIDGKDYYFISRNIFEQQIQDKKFVEYGEYEKNLYGTSKESIENCCNKLNKICILNLYPDALLSLRNSNILPYIIYIQPPNLEKLKLLKINDQTIQMKDIDFLDVIEKGHQIEMKYGHLFDKTLCNIDMEQTYQQLKTLILDIQYRPMWIPTCWFSQTILD
ncbi:unnamed protein product [Didymodactylos carnosus]|uniref:Uncharacterized protein n=1 Tax=Didymodactylos carnosus TaxID=1234261 RepID=A0A814MYP3_9BILA|nr:unnamed protein product [Didymodactylos carnosus]CAF1084350.1 unnamed protein product [Didymodactylos carnosus]CAF3706212.1 unnamed protein product [Didymodactylos carnosus]CAF3849978.1 unnamed protein product [Didymodactylos carnosus]